MRLVLRRLCEVNPMNKHDQSTANIWLQRTRASWLDERDGIGFDQEQRRSRD